MSTHSCSKAGLALVLTMALLAGCGGGGGGAPDPAPAPMTLGPGASSVSSADGKVTITVGDNALQAATPVSVAQATPDAELAADPALVPGTTYAYTSPGTQVPEQVLITIESPLAVSEQSTRNTSTALDGGRARALALPAGWTPPPSCLINSATSGGLLAKNVYVPGSECPSTPAPACVKVHTFGSGGTFLTLCAPAREIIIILAADNLVCPVGYREVTGDPAFADLANANGSARICERQGSSSAPMLSQSGKPTGIQCTPLNGKFLCPAPLLPSGVYSVLWDKAPPPAPTLHLNGIVSAESSFIAEEVGAPTELKVTAQATDVNGLGGVELMEITHIPTIAEAANGADIQVVQRWRADPALFAGAAVKTFQSFFDSAPGIELPYSFDGPAKRRFFVRSYDRAGNSSRTSTHTLTAALSKIVIESFTVTPATVPPQGGPVTLAWSVKGAQVAGIDQGVGAITVFPTPYTPTTGSRVVNAGPNTTFTLSATHPTRLPKSASLTVGMGADTTAPTVTLAASPASVVAPGASLLVATASDAVGVTRVEFYRGNLLLGTDTAAPFEWPVNLTEADIGSVAFGAKACDAANNCSANAPATVSVGADITPPTVNLTANPGTVLLPGSATLLATATDNIGVSKVEFYRGATLLATANAAPFQHSLSFSLADVGTVSFTAKAFDAQGNNATSAAAIVTVGTPSTGDTYASPNGVDTGNSTCAQATPCLSIAKAASLAQAGATVWLQDGIYTPATQPASINLPAGLTLRALTPGLAVLRRGLVLQGSATVVGLVIDRGPGNNFDTAIVASSGNVTVEGVRFAGLLSTGTAPISASGSAQVTLSPGNLADYTDTLVDISQAQSGNTFALLSGNARLTINGGSLGGKGLGGGSPSGFAAGFAAFRLQGNAQLVINNATVAVNTNGILLEGASTQLTMINSTLQASGMQGPGRGINAWAGTPSIMLTGSTVKGFNYGQESAPLGVGSISGAGVAAQVTLTDSVLSSGSYGLVVIDGTTPSLATIVAHNAQIRNNLFGGLVCLAACIVDIDGGLFSANGSTSVNLACCFDFHGGLSFATPGKAYTVKLRNASVINNTSVSAGATNTADNSGITLTGNGASSFDLGTLASPGGNIFTGNSSGDQTSGIHVAAAPGVTVNAVGNTFAAGVQGANSLGQYQLGAGPCGASACSVGSGAGANFRVTSGSLRLAQ